jgi:hypothetical protein
MDIDGPSRLSPPPHPATFIYSYHNLLQQHHQLQQQQLQQQQQQQQEEEGPLDMSIKKKPRPATPPPSYHFPPIFVPALPHPLPSPYYTPSPLSPSVLSDRLPPMPPPPPTYEEASNQFMLRASALAAAAKSLLPPPPPPPPPRRPETAPDEPRPIREITIITGN